MVCDKDRVCVEMAMGSFVELNACQLLIDKSDLNRGGIDGNCAGVAD